MNGMDHICKVLQTGRGSAVRFEEAAMWQRLTDARNYDNSATR